MGERCSSIGSDMGTRERRQRELREAGGVQILEKSHDIFLNVATERLGSGYLTRLNTVAAQSMLSFPARRRSHTFYVEATRILADMFQSVNPAASDFDREFLKCTQILFDFYKYPRNYFKAFFYFGTKHWPTPRFRRAFAPLKKPKSPAPACL